MSATSCCLTDSLSTTPCSSKSASGKLYSTTGIFDWLFLGDFLIHIGAFECFCAFLNFGYSRVPLNILQKKARGLCCGDRMGKSGVEARKPHGHSSSCYARMARFQRNAYTYSSTYEATMATNHVTPVLCRYWSIQGAVSPLFLLYTAMLFLSMVLSTTVQSKKREG